MAPAPKPVRDRGNTSTLIVAGGLATLAIAALVRATRAGDTDTLDLDILRRVRGHGAEGGRRVAKTMTVLGSPEASLVMAAAISTWQARRHTPGARRSAVQLLASTAGAVAAQRTVKALVDRRRPPGGWQGGSVESSFPSGHAAATLALVFATTRVLRRTRRGPPWLWASIGTAVTAAVGTSRLYLDEHWPTDVFVGTAIGVAVAALVGIAVA